MSVNVIDKGNKYRLQYMFKGKRHSKTIEKCGPILLDREKLKFMNEVHSKDDGSNLMFVDFTEQWMQDYAEVRLQPKTITAYEQYLRTYINPYFKDKKLIDISAYDITRFLNTLTHLTTCTIKKYKTLLSCIFSTAEKWDLIKYNPIHKVTLPKGKPSTVHPTFLTQDEVNILLEKLKDVCPKYQAIILLALKGGLRRGEILGLTWNNINFNEKTITITQSVCSTKYSGLIVKDTKNVSSHRTIYVSDDILNAISQLPHKDNLVFGLLDPDAVTRWFKRFLKLNNLKDIRFHDLRHTHATLLIANNVNIKTVSARLGHSQISTTMNIYTHALSSEDKIASMVIKSTV